MDQNQNPYEQYTPDPQNNPYGQSPAQQNNRQDQGYQQENPYRQQHKSSISTDLPQNSPYQEDYSVQPKKRLNPLAMVIPAIAVIAVLVTVLIIILSGSDSDGSASGSDGGSVGSSDTDGSDDGDNAGNGSTSGSSKPETISISGKTYRTDMTGTLDLTGLGLYDKDIQDLKYMTELDEIIISDNNLMVPTVLGELTNLKKLTLHNNEVTNISFVSSLTRLEVFGAGGNAINDLAPLSDLKNLKELWLFDNSIKDVSPIRNFTKLEYASFRNNFIGDFTPLAGCKFKELHLDNQNGAINGNLDAIKGLTIYENLYVGDGNYGDLDALLAYAKNNLYTDSDGFKVDTFEVK